MLACSAILASAADCAHLSLAILPERFHFSDMEAALQANVLKHDRLCFNLTTPPPTTTGPKARHQRNWDSLIIRGHFNSFLSAADTRGQSVCWLASKRVKSLVECSSNFISWSPRGELHSPSSSRLPPWSPSLRSS